MDERAGVLWSPRRCSRGAVSSPPLPPPPVGVRMQRHRERDECHAAIKPKTSPHYPPSTHFSSFPLRVPFPVTPTALPASHAHGLLTPFPSFPTPPLYLLLPHMQIAQWSRQLFDQAAAVLPPRRPLGKEKTSVFVGALRTLAELVRSPACADFVRTPLAGTGAVGGAVAGGGGAPLAGNDAEAVGSGGEEGVDGPGGAEVGGFSPGMSCSPGSSATPGSVMLGGDAFAELLASEAAAAATATDATSQSRGSGVGRGRADSGALPATATAVGGVAGGSGGASGSGSEAASTPFHFMCTTALDALQASSQHPSARSSEDQRVEAKSAGGKGREERAGGR